MTTPDDAKPCHDHTAPADDIPPPSDAVRTFAWQLDRNWFRDFEGSTHRGGPARVHVYGRQHADGTIRRWIAVSTRNLDALDARAARELAAALIDAAGEIERFD